MFVAKVTLLLSYVRMYVGTLPYPSYLFELVADEGEGLVDRVRVARQSDDALGAGTVANIDLGTALNRKKDFNIMEMWKVIIRLALDLTLSKYGKSSRFFSVPHLIPEPLDDLSLLADDAAHFLQGEKKR